VEEEWRKVKKSDWEVQATLDGAQVVKVVSGGGTKAKKVAGIPKSKGELSFSLSNSVRSSQRKRN